MNMSEQLVARCFETYPSSSDAHAASSVNPSIDSDQARIERENKRQLNPHILPETLVSVGSLFVSGSDETL